MVSEEGDDWDDYLPAVMYAYRSSVHTTTKISPYKAIFGREAPLPIDISLFKQKQYQDPITYAEKVRRKIEIMNKSIKTNTTHSQEKMKIVYDKNKTNKQMKVGQYVLVKRNPARDGANPKLQAKFTGPYEIVRIFPKGFIEIRIAKDKKEKINLQRVKEFWGKPPTNVPNKTEKKVNRGVGNRVEREVKVILVERERRNRNGQVYL